MSIRKVFRNFKLSILIVFLLMGIITYSFINIHYDLEKIRHLATLKTQSSEVLSFESEDDDMSLRKLQQHILYMSITLDKIFELTQADPVQMYLINKSESEQSFSAIKSQITELASFSKQYYRFNKASDLSRVQAIQAAIPSSIITYEEDLISVIAYKNRIAFYITAFNAINILLIFLWYARRLSLIYKDIKVALSVDQEERTKSFASEEFAAIKRRTERRPMASGGKNLQDPLTGLLNEKGVISEFSHRGSFSAKEYVCVTMFDMDNFKEHESNYGKSFTDTVIKKIGFIMGLEKKPADIIGRIGEDKFLMIIAREDKESAYKSMDKIRQVIEETVFKPTRSEKVSVTVSGGFALKERHEKLEHTISSAQSLVRKAKLQGKNSLARVRSFDDEKNQRM